MISTRGRYAVRILLDLAEHSGGDYIPMKEISARQEISLKYTEKIMPLLREGGLVDSIHGLGGGYKLKKDPSDITVYDILKLAEGDLAPVSCLSCGEEGVNTCPRAAECKTLPMWEEYYRITKEYFASVTLADLAGQNSGGSYVI